MSRQAEADPEPTFILASASPRRQRLLASAGLRFVVDPAEISEATRAGEAPARYVQRLAREKAREVVARRRARGDRRPVLAADTIVVLDDEVVGKPADRATARRQLQRLAGRDHEVITAFCLVAPDGGEAVDVVITRVTFKVLSSAQIEAYLDTGEWEDKAGGYAIQGGAAYMVRGVVGSYTNVVGLPLAEAVEALGALREGGP